MKAMLLTDAVSAGLIARQPDQRLCLVTKQEDEDGGGIVRWKVSAYEFFDFCVPQSK